MLYIYVYRCKTCPNIITGTNIKFKSGKQFKVKQTMNCASKNVIYSLICDKCNEFYIGQTRTELRKRVTVHRQQTRTQELRLLKVNKHFHECSGGKFKIFPIYKLYGCTDSMRDQKELHFIKMLKPGLNAWTFSLFYIFAGIIMFPVLIYICILPGII